MSNDNAVLSADARFERFYFLHHAWVLNLLIRLTREGDRAADIAQSVWLKLYANWDRFEPRIQGTGVAWLRVVVVRAFYDDVRGRASCAALPLDDLSAGRRELTDPSDSPFDLAAVAERRRLFETLIASLDPDDRHLVEALALRGLSAAATAELLRLSTSAVVSRWFRLRRRLRDLAARPGLGYNPA